MIPAKMLAKSLALVFLASLVVAEIPPYIKVCGRRNPNLDKCVRESVEALRDKLREGIPELEVPSMEPLLIPGFTLSETEQLRAYAKNVKLSGLSNFEAKSMHNDLANQTLELEVDFKKIICDTDCDITGKIIVPISGKGPIHIEAENVHASVVMKYIKPKKNGVEYMFFPSMTTKLTIGNFKAHFMSADGADSTFGIAINSALDGARQEMLETFRPIFERVISEEVLKRANQVCTHFTFDELHPDRE